VWRARRSGWRRRRRRSPASSTATSACAAHDGSSPRPEAPRAPAARPRGAVRSRTPLLAHLAAQGGAPRLLGSAVGAGRRGGGASRGLAELARGAARGPRSSPTPGADGAARHARRNAPTARWPGSSTPAMRRPPALEPAHRPPPRLAELVRRPPPRAGGTAVARGGTPDLDGTAAAGDPQRRPTSSTCSSAPDGAVSGLIDFGDTVVERARCVRARGRRRRTRWQGHADPVRAVRAARPRVPHRGTAARRRSSPCSTT